MTMRISLQSDKREEKEKTGVGETRDPSVFPFP
jgi:hypothetical protein